MKIISGILKGRSVKGFQIDGTRPTMDRVKESLFAMIQNSVQGSIVLDLFAGSGNLGIEAISNGAKLCYFNDINKECIKVINNNIKTFDITNQSVVLNKSWNDALKYLHSLSLKFDLIFLDPPYKLDCLNEVIDTILEYNLINENGLIICEVSSNYLKEQDNLVEIKNKKYGDKLIIIYKNK